MALGWHDVLSVASDIIGLLGIPVLVVTTFGLFREIKKERAERKALKIVSEGCLEFLDSEHKIGINLVPVERVPLMPRPGDFVYLPGEGPKYGAGEYEVERVRFFFSEALDVDQPSPAALSKVTAYVRKKR
jgi:hypothetical protein